VQPRRRELRRQCQPERGEGRYGLAVCKRPSTVERSGVIPEHWPKRVNLSLWAGRVVARGENGT
jgi:hypothetical protein